ARGAARAEADRASKRAPGTLGAPPPRTRRARGRSRRRARGTSRRCNAIGGACGTQAPPVTVTDPMQAWTFERKLLVAALIGWAVIAALNLGWGPPLGHDESAFALVGRG